MNERDTISTWVKSFNVLAISNEYINIDKQKNRRAQTSKSNERKISRDYGTIRSTQQKCDAEMYKHSEEMTICWPYSQASFYQRVAHSPNSVQCIFHTKRREPTCTNPIIPANMLLLWVTNNFWLPEFIVHRHRMITNLLSAIDINRSDVTVNNRLTTYLTIHLWPDKLYKFSGTDSHMFWVARAVI